MKLLPENPKILVTGGAGFIGSHLVEALLRNDCQVVVLDNFSTGKKENLAPFSSDRRFTLITGDIRDLETCRKAMESVDYVLHEAALGSVPRSIADPATTFAVNAGGFANILAAARKAGVKRLVYASSSSVYGDEPSPVKREDLIGQALSPYAVSKRCNELLALNFSRVYHFSSIGLRYFNVFGPRQNPDGPYAAVIPKFLAALQSGQSPVIYGDGGNSRDFTYVSNVVEANLLALANTDKQADDTIYNVGCQQSTSINELFGTLKNLLSRPAPGIADIQPVYQAPRAGDIASSLADISKITRLLGYRPEVSLTDGLKKMVNFLPND